MNGREFTEMHVDGGVTRNLFFYPPSDWPGDDADPHLRLLAGANVYAVVAGKVYADPQGTDRKLGRVTVRVVSTLLSSALRNELFRLDTHCKLRDMNLFVAAVPTDYSPLPSPAEFDPQAMTPLFDEGYARASQGRVWNQEKVDRAVSEELARRGTELATTPTGEVGPLGDPRTPAAGGGPRAAASRPLLLRQMFGVR